MKRNKKATAVFGVMGVLFMIYSITLMFPFAWMIVNSLKTNQEFFSNVWGLPERPRFSNYVNSFLFELKGFSVLMMTLNSLFLTVVSVIVSVFFCSCAAYGIAKFKFVGRSLIYGVVVTLMIIPTIGATSATYRLMLATGLYDTHLGMILMYSGGFGMSFLILYGFFKNLSWNYAEAAYVDGASDWQVFLRVMIPQAIPAISAMAILQSIGVWNDFLSPYMFLPSYPTLAVGLDAINSRMTYSANYPLLFAIMTISIFPIILVFTAFSDTIMENTVAGGLKG